MKNDTNFGQRLRLEGRNETHLEWGTLSTTLIEQRNAMDTLHTAYERARWELDEKSRRWAETFDPLMEFRIVED